MKNIKTNIKNYVQLFLAFFKIGAVTFGGGLAMLPLLKKDLAESKKWVTEEEIIDYFAIGQCTPGIIAVNVATFTGYKMNRISGAVAATLGVISPSIIIILFISAFISNFENIVLVKKAILGVNIAAAVLLTRAVFDFGKKTITDIYTFLIALLAFSCMFFFNLTGFWVILISAFLGWLVKTCTEHISANKKTDM